MQQNTLDESGAFRIIVIDDDLSMRQSLQQLLLAAGWVVELRDRADHIETIIERVRPDVILSDVKMPGTDGLTLLRSIASEEAPPMVMISAHGDIPMAVEAMQAGAYSFLEKPYDARRLLKLLQNAAERNRMRQEGIRLRARLAELSGLDRVLLGETAPIKALRKQIIELSDADVPVLLQGETGTGKEVVARALHDLSTRSEAPFVPVNCAAIAADSFERFMFGVEDGPPGAFERAQGGTLFLDEIGNCPLEQQNVFLRALETKEITRVGANEPIKLNFRLISASNNSLKKAVDDGLFRANLLYRINTLVFVLPTLREMREDIPVLFEKFLTEFSALQEITMPDITAEDVSTLMAHHWPGNVRELRHVAERRSLAARLNRGSVAEALSESAGEADEFPETLREATAAFERRLIARALLSKGGRMDDVAASLGIARRTLNEKIVKLGLDKSALFTNHRENQTG